MSLISSIYFRGLTKKQAKDLARKERREKNLRKSWSARPRATGGTKNVNPKT